MGRLVDGGVRLRAERGIGSDVSIGYLSHDDTSVRLYFQETLTFLVHTAEAAVALAPAAA